MSVCRPTCRPKLKDADLAYYAAWICPPEGDRLSSVLMRELAWEQSRIHLYGRAIKIPRLNAWYGDPDCHYTYSRKSFVPHPWHPELAQMRHHLEVFCGVSFNSVLANYYRGGQDSVAWHSDNEPELGVNPIIASVSLGGTRCFQMRHKKIAEERYALELEHGSLLVMQGPTQHFWQHQIPKRKYALPRINLTFRRISKTQKE